MKPNVLLAIVTAAFAVSAGACLWLIQTYAQGPPPWTLFLIVPLVTQACIVVILLALPLVLIVGAIPLTSLAHRSAGVAVVLGLLGALYGGVQTLPRNVLVNGTSYTFADAAPHLAGSLACLPLGLFVALVALGLLKLRGR